MAIIEIYNITATALPSTSRNCLSADGMMKVQECLAQQATYQTCQSLPIFVWVALAGIALLAAMDLYALYKIGKAKEKKKDEWIEIK